MVTAKDASFGQRLQNERMQRNLTQKELAQLLQTTKVSINRWEQDKTKPQPAMLRNIYTFFGKTDEEFGAITRIWNVPFEQNPFFRGRDTLLTALHKELKGGGSIALTQYALSGLGGIGKTQAAVEYAYRYSEKYTAVLWVRADSREFLASDFALLLPLLQFNESAVTNQFIAIQTVRQWLQTQSGWLLIFDNLEDISILSDFLPTQRKGSVLITTRAQVRGKYIKKLDVMKLDQQESLRFLLRRAKLIEEEEQQALLAEAELVSAEQLCKALDGLPLALDQAAAYIEENQCAISTYYTNFLQYRATLLEWHSENQDYPHSVATTWALSFQKIEHTHPISADLLRLCAFLHPDAIPEEFFTACALHLGPYLETIAKDPFALDAIIKPLFSFSLILRDKNTKTLIIHRLVQAVLQDRMGEDTSRKWVERTIYAMNALFPDGSFATWEQCERYLPHVLLCATYVEKYAVMLSEAADLLTRVGYYLKERTRYFEAEAMLKQALHLYTQLFGPRHIRAVTTLQHLATTYRELCFHEQSYELYQQALEIQEQTFGHNHLENARLLKDLAMLYQQQGDGEKAEHHFLQAIAIHEQLLGTEHLETIESIHHLAGFYFHEGRYAEAEERWQKTLIVRERVLGLQHPDTAKNLHNLAIIYITQKRNAEAETLLLQSITILQQVVGFYHRFTATCLSNLAEFYITQERFEEAARYLEQVLTIRKRILGAEHPDTLKIVQLLTELYQRLGKPVGAESVLHDTSQPQSE